MIFVFATLTYRPPSFPPQGDIFNLLLTPISDVKEVLNPDNSTTTRVHFEQWQMDYIYAQHDGHFTRDCSSYHDDCPYSIFQVQISSNSF